MFAGEGGRAVDDVLVANDSSGRNAGAGEGMGSGAVG